MHNQSEEAARDRFDLAVYSNSVYYTFWPTTLRPAPRHARHCDEIQSCAHARTRGGCWQQNHDPCGEFASRLKRISALSIAAAINFSPPQVVTKPEFDFTRAPIFRNVTIAAWDPGKYNGTLEDWLTSADYDLFSNYELYRRRYPKSRAFLIDPHSVWRLWQSLQMFAGNRPISKNPPSSGFIGKL